SLAKRTGLDVHTLIAPVEEVPLQPLAPREAEPQPAAANAGAAEESSVDEGSAPPPGYDYTYDYEAGAQPVRKAPRSRSEQFKLPPQRLLTLLLLHLPELALQVEDCEPLEAANEDGRLTQFLELVQLIQRRPHL